METYGFFQMILEMANNYPREMGLRQKDKGK